MKSVFGALLSAAIAKALVTREPSCCFGISGHNETVGQLSDGQNRIGGGLPPSTYCITSNIISDGNGRGCILTPQTTQFQCDQGAGPTPGFSIDCNGLISHNGSTQFWQCQTGDNSEANIYTTTGGTKCSPIELEASACIPTCPPPSPSPSPKSCPPDFTNTNTFQYPHLIVSVDSTHPIQSNGTSYLGSVTTAISTIVNYDIPQSYTGKSCSFVFLFPAQSSESTSSFSFSGNGKLSFTELDAPATTQTTFQNKPGTKVAYPDVVVTPGAVESGYVISTFECPAGSVVSYEIGEGVGGDTVFRWFQDYNPSAIGPYVFPC